VLVDKRKELKRMIFIIQEREGFYASIQGRSGGGRDGEGGVVMEA
jgi:hypothetical protein